MMRPKYLIVILLLAFAYNSSYSNTNSLKFVNLKNNGIRVTQSSSLNLTNQGTIEAWIYLVSYADFGGIIHKGDKSSFADESYTLQLWNNNKLYFGLANTLNSYNLQSTSSLQTSQWYHVCATWNSSGMRLYINGKLEASSSNVITLSYSNLNDPTKNGLNIGRQLNEDYNSSYQKFTFDGLIDEVRIWNTCLSGYQLQKRMYQELNSNDSLWYNLVGYWPFNEGSGDYVNDNSSNSNNGSFIPTNSNKPRWKTNLPPVSLTWNGSVSQDWNNINNWQEGILPHAFTDILIPFNTGNSPKILNNGLNCGSINIQAGNSLSIATGKSLTVWGNIILKSDSLKTASLINLGSLNVVGQSIFERKIVSDGWHYISSPVSNASSNSFWGAAIYGYSEWTGQWSKIINNQTLNCMEGYDVYVKNNDKTVNYTGTLNSGNFSKNLTHNNDGYNLIGNPYPATIDWDASNGWTKNNINGAVYIWDPAQNNFTTYINGSGTNGGSRYIAPTQGFFIRANAGGGSIAMTPAVMVDNINSQFRSPNPGKQLSLMVEGNGRMDETRIRFHESASEFFEDNLDAYKVYSNSSDVPQIYSVLEDGTFMSINSLPENSLDVSIPVSFIAPADGSYNLSFKMDGFPTEIDLFLEDLLTHKVVDLKSGNYQFFSNSNDIRERFIIHIQMLKTITTETAISSTIKESNMRSINVFSTQKTLFVDTRQSETDKAIVKVYNMLGEEVSQKQIPHQNIYSYTMNCKAGYYFVEVSSQNGNEVFKVFFN